MNEHQRTPQLNTFDSGDPAAKSAVFKNKSDGKSRTESSRNPTRKPGRKKGGLKDKIIGFLFLLVVPSLALSGFSFLIGTQDIRPEIDFIEKQAAQRGCAYLQAAESSTPELLDENKRPGGRHKSYREERVALCKNNGVINPGDFVAKQIDMTPVHVVKASGPSNILNKSAAELKNRISVGTTGSYSSNASVSEYPYTHNQALQDQLKDDFQRPENHQDSFFTTCAFVLLIVAGSALLLGLVGAFIFPAGEGPESKKIAGLLD